MILDFSSDERAAAGPSLNLVPPAGSLSRLGLHSASPGSGRGGGVRRLSYALAVEALGCGLARSSR